MLPSLTVYSGASFLSLSDRRERPRVRDHGEPSGLHGYRKVAFGGSKVKKSAMAWTKTDEKLLKKYIDDMCRSLTVSGRTKLAQILQEIAREITLL